MKPFQVMCIAEACYDVLTGITEPSPVEVGNEYTVIWEGRGSGLWLYRLAGQDPDNGFDAMCFATLPGQTAEEMEAEVKEAIIC